MNISREAVTWTGVQIAGEVMMDDYRMNMGLERSGST